MHYDTTVDPAASNTSHAIVLDLVGEDKEVLDVGCSTGYLAKVLGERRCRVTGVEIDPEAADVARVHCEAVHVADLDRVDLASLPFEHPFDVVVFADVLEHLHDPVAALKASAALLRPGGYVVISIPNVAHGAVRLALAGGHFDYHDNGLLDRTHVRFFTRSTLFDLLTASGFTAQDLRRTTAGIFATEIRVDPTSVPGELVAELEADPEAETYQFVLSAVPIGEVPEAVVSLLAGKDHEIDVLRSQLGEILRLLGPEPGSPLVGVVASAASGAERVRAQVVASELRRRLDGFRVEPLAPAELEGGEVPDVVVVVGSLEPGATAALERLSSAEKVPVLRVPGETPAGATPDPAVASASVYDAELVGNRARFLRLTGVLPPEGDVAVASLRRLAAGGRGNLADLAATLQLELVLVDAPAGEASWQVPADDPLDVVAAVSTAALVLSDDPVLLATAISHRRPVLGLLAGGDQAAALTAWLGDAGLLVASLHDVPDALEAARARAAEGGWVAGLAEALGRALDELAGAVVGAVGAGAAQSVPQRILELQARVNALSATNAALLSRLRAERVAFGRRAGELLAGGAAPDSAPVAPEPVNALEQVLADHRRLAEDYRRLAEDNDRLAEEGEAARRELQALLATKTFRALQPARDTYRRLRSVRSVVR